MYKDLLNEYLKVFPNEIDRQSMLNDFLDKFNDEEIIDWNNFDGHIVASSFVYSKSEDKFLVLFHNEFKIFLYPGGHIDKNDINSLEAAKRELKEETGITNVNLFNVTDNILVPLDIDTHHINYNEKLNLPEHYHFDFRYLFVVDKFSNIQIDKNESSEYKFISREELINDKFFGKVADKVLNLIDNN